MDTEEKKIIEKIYKCDICNDNFDENEFKFTNDKNKCIFHCDKESWITKDNPENNKFNLGTEIVYFWDEEKVNFFWSKFKEFIEKKRDLSEKNLYYRFDNFIFPESEQNTFKDYSFESPLVFQRSCIFEGDVDFFNSTFKSEVYFNNCEIKGNISFTKSIFAKRFTFNNMKNINKISFRFSKFEEKVELKESIIKGDVSFRETQFNKTTDFYRTKFNGKVNFHKTDFKGISVFTETEFLKDVNFKYVTFEKIAIFRDGIFKEKLDLRDSIFKDERNFLDIKVNKVNRETARIIKNSFEQQNNIIAANKFYALEMKERENELTWKKDFFEKLVFKFHGISSNHSQNWLLALFWIIVIGMLSSTIDFLYFSCEPYVFYDFSIINLSLAYFGVLIFYYLIATYFDGNYFRTTLSLFALVPIYWYLTNDFLFYNFSKTINPFSIMSGQDNINGIQLIYKIIIAYLIYQLIISIRQNTRRK
ncbi:pentapeptide repeat-containing protein [Poseidonibacter lekithochrous]|uniref:pentapeptide repeat-containing protein n=1 Tax=Poseidonibacter TaxID=2321187 RepID=UPI001C08E3B8|nr:MULTISPECIES: pentapeptide repeat-containing protein [Poseidonibacter]MBU3014197.1 pentapeptide repeat-containing protein [Poseidonibacter lekithochrous]MDO6827494.1 pentapeptide repeat-containing protein [Poseidonibacter sp. 1_MG-2023]